MRQIKRRHKLPEPYFQTELGKLYHADCRDILPCLDADNLIILADPPYNYNIQYLSHNDNMTDKEYQQWIKSWWEVIPTKRKIIFIGTGNQRFWYHLNPTATACWYKKGNPKSGNPFQWNEWEPILVWNVSFRLSDVITQSITISKKEVEIHPCPKPLKLLIQLVSRIRSKGIICDPFSGSGKTAAACEILGRQWIAVEKEKEYCEDSVKRIQKEVMLKKTKNKANIFLKPKKVKRNHNSILA